MYDVFICSKVNGEYHSTLNKRLKEIVEDQGFSVYLPQAQLPIDANLDALAILEANERSVDASKILLIVFDGIDLGGAMEAERGYIRNKVIIGYRTKEEDIGKMMEGYWKRIQGACKASSLEDVYRILKNLKANLSNKGPEEKNGWS